MVPHPSRELDAGEIAGGEASRSTPRARALQTLDQLWKQRRYEELGLELSRAELAGEIGEFDALHFQAVLAIAARSSLARDYLEMADAVAASPYERATVAESLAAYDLLQGKPLDAAERCLAGLSSNCQSEGLWRNLLLALHHLGDVETIDATLRGFARLDVDCAARLVRAFLSEPGLRDVRARPAFRALEHRRVAG